MSRIVELTIKNYRGIKEFCQKFDRSFVCLIGRGDSGKTTILEAISAVFSPSWNHVFHDTDFHQCDVDNPIEIIVSIVDFPQQLLKVEKYGLFVRSLNPETGVIEDRVIDGHQSVLTLKLIVDKTLEPRWTIINTRAQEDKSISASDRAKLNCFIVSDYIDRHFSWNKGAPLYSLLKAKDKGVDDGSKNVVIEALREAKAKIDSGNFEGLLEVEKDIAAKASAIGL